LIQQTMIISLVPRSYYQPGNEAKAGAHIN